MPFTSYVQGNWLTLPEFGLTERFGGDNTSVNNAIQKQNAFNISSTPVNFSSYNAPASSQGSQPTTSSSSRPSSSSSSSSSRSSSSGGSSNTSDQSLLDSLDQTYGDILKDVGRQRSALQGSRGDLMNIASSPYDQALPMLLQARDQGMRGIEAGKQQVMSQETNALDAARRLYNELSTRNQQMFGSGMSSSAGQAASELLGREQSRSFGDIRQQSINQQSDYNRQMVDLQDKYNAQVQNIELQKQQALSRAELDYRDRLAQLDQIETQTKQNRSVEKLNLLKQFREEVRMTNMMAEQYKQQLGAMSYQQQLQMQQMMQGYGNDVNSTLGSVQQGANQYGQNAMQSVGNIMGGNSIMANQQSPLSIMSGYRKPTEDIYGLGN